MGHYKNQFEIVKGKISTLEKDQLNEMLKKSIEMAFFKEHTYKVVDKKDGNLIIKVGTKAEPLKPNQSRQFFRLITIKLIYKNE